METTEKVTTTYRKYIIRHAPFFPDLFSYFVVSKSMKDCVASICLELFRDILNYNNLSVK